MRVLDRVADFIERLIDTIGRSVSWLVLAVIFLLFVQNPLRQFVGAGQFFANDMGQLAHAAIFMIGAAYAWRWNSQVRIDMFYQRMQPRTRAVVNLAGTIVLLLPWLALLIWYSVPMVALSVRIRERFPETGNPGSFLFRVLLLVFLAMLLLQAIAVIARAIVVIRDSSRSRT